MTVQLSQSSLTFVLSSSTVSTMPLQVDFSAAIKLVAIEQQKQLKNKQCCIGINGHCVCCWSVITTVHGKLLPLIDNNEMIETLYWTLKVLSNLSSFCTAVRG